MFRLFKHYIPRSYLLLGLAEAWVLILAMYLGVALRFGAVIETIPDTGPLLPRALVFAAVMISVMTMMGLYKPNLRYGRSGVLLRVGLSVVLGAVAMSLVFYAFPDFFLGRGAFAFTFVMAFVGLVATRGIFFRIVAQDTLKRRILVLGAGKRALPITQTLRRKVDRRGLNILGFVHVPGEHDEVDASEVLHLDTTLLEFAQAHRVDEIVVALEDRRKVFPTHALLDCKMSGIDVIDMLTFFERQTGKVRLDMLHPSWMIFSDGFAHHAETVWGKRIFDIVVSVALLSLAWPLMVLATAAIWLESGGCGPIFYKQVRVGQNWRLVQIIKFRSMSVDAEKDGVARWATQNDSRVTRVGAFIRKTRIDELPQLINVLKGEMSFVGPRPERPQFVEQLSEKIPYYAERHRVKPGITGWAQVRYPYGSSEQDAVEKLQYDLYYVKNYSLFLDLVVLFQTAEVILWGRGAR